MPASPFIVSVRVLSYVQLVSLLSHSPGPPNERMGLKVQGPGGKGLDDGGEPGGGRDGLGGGGEGLGSLTLISNLSRYPT